MAGAATKRELVDQIMGGRLAEYVAARRTGADKRSWGRIAADIRADYSIDVSYEALRLWFPESADTAGDKAAS